MKIIVFSGNKEDQNEADLPSALVDERPNLPLKEAFERNSDESGAVDIIRVPPPSDGDVHSVGKWSLNMLEIMEVLINTNLENQISKTTWSHDLLKDLIRIIGHAEEMLQHGNNTDAEQFGSSKNEQSHSKEFRSNKVGSTIKDDSTGSVDGEQEFENDLFREQNIEKIKSPKEIPNNRSSRLESEDLENKMKSKNLFELVIVQQFQTIKSTILTETEILTIQVKTCLDNLEITKNLIDIINDKELESQFIDRRLEVMLLVSTIKDSVDSTKNLLSTDEYEKNLTLESFKKLLDVVTESKIVKDFLDKYVKYLQLLKEIVVIGKHNYNTNKSEIGNEVHLDSLTSVDQNINNSEEENNIDNDEATENWKDDDIAYQVDDKERVVLVSKVDAGPLFTDKLSAKAETVVSLLPKSLESPFNPQVLLERIRANPKYPRNLTSTTQYNLLTCLPQPYFTRIMLSGEFYND